MAERRQKIMFPAQTLTGSPRSRLEDVRRDSLRRNGAGLWDAEALTVGQPMRTMTSSLLP